MPNWDLPLLMEPGTLVVFEGLDATGKSTQMERFERSVHAPQMGTPLIDPKPMFTHQPSGATGIGPDIYELTEKVDWRTGHPLTRQFLHLAAHTEHYAHDIAPALREGGVFLDRCWWSTVAYGWTGEVPTLMGSFREFIDFARIPTRGIMPSVVFLFMERLEEQEHAAVSGKVVRNYERLARRYAETTVIVPRLPRGETTAFISGELHKRGLVQTVTKGS